MIVFLNFDGVLHGISGPTFDDKCISHLEASLTAYDAKVVIISSWKDELPLEALTRRMGQLGVRVIGACAEEPAFTKTPREHLVDEWLRSHEYEGPWIAVHDHPSWYGRHDGRVLGAAPRTGFGEEDIPRMHALVRKVLLSGRGELALEAMFDHAGGLLSASQVADLLSIEPAQVHEKAGLGELLSVSQAGERQYPAFQFVDGDVIPHLSEILALLDTSSETSKLRFFVTDDQDLNCSAAAALREGRDLELVKRKARQFDHQLAR